MSRNMQVIVIVLLLFGLTIYQMEKTPTNARPAVSVPSEAARGKPAPVLALKGLDGKSYQAGGVRDKPLVLNFWASWCGPCHQEAPDLKRVYEKYGNQFDLYGVNVTKGDSLADVKAFVGKYGLTFPILLDEQGKAAEMYRILFVPTSFLIDKQGVLLDVIHVLPPDELERRIQSLISSEL
jgi:thiol-disulfide isomerase/thioredoxin